MQWITLLIRPPKACKTYLNINKFDVTRYHLQQKYRRAVAMPDVEQGSPDHADARVMIHMEERELLPLFAAQNNENGVEIIKVL